MTTYPQPKAAAGVSKDTRMSTAKERSPEHCQTCGQTDREYSHTARICSDPWHADAHLRAHYHRKVPSAMTAKETPCGDCGKTNPHPMRSTQAMRDRIRELSNGERDDYDRAVLCVLDDLEAALRTLPSSDQCAASEALAVTIEECAKVADDFAAYEQTVIDRAHADDALSESGRKDIVSSAGSRQIAAEQIAYDIRAIAVPQAAVAETNGAIQEALTLGRDAVMESFDHVSDKADHDIADMRLRSIDAALALNVAPGHPLRRHEQKKGE